VAGKQRTEPPKTEEEARLRATGRSIYRVHKDTRRAYWWVNAIITARLPIGAKESAVRREVRAQIESYEREAGIDVKAWETEA
jgi:hypothetical protein